MAFPPVCPHDPIEQIGDGLFMARGSIQMNPLVRITRNMAIVRENGELTLVNPIRLDDAELAHLESLGTVKHLLRLGAMHGLDDPFYMDRYQPKFWSQEGGTLYTVPPIDYVLREGGELPFENAKLFCFRETKQPECAIRLESGRGTLLTADSIQHYGDFSHNNLPARLALPFLGFSKTTLIGPIWLKVMTPDGGSLRDEFDRLLTLQFDALLSAHGTFRETGAHEAVRIAIEKALPS